MELFVNITYGGETKAHEHLPQWARNMRKQLKAAFAGVDFSFVNTITLYTCFNGNISTYYPETGLYKPAYYKQRKKLIADICFSNTEWTGELQKDKDKFHALYKGFLSHIADILQEKAEKNKLAFEKDIFQKCVAETFTVLQEV